VYVILLNNINFICTNVIKITNNQIIMHALYFRFFVKIFLIKNKNGKGLLKEIYVNLK